MASSQIVTQSHFIFGVRTGVANNICYVDEQTVIYPAGNNLVRYNLDERSQKFIPGTEKSRGMVALAISPDRRYLAVSERAERPFISVYGLHKDQSKKRKVLTAGDVAVQEFVCMAFSHDSKYLISQSGEPDWTLSYWAWQKQKVLATMVTGGPSSPVNQVSFSPEDSTQMCVSGHGVFRLLQFTNGVLKQLNTQKKKIVHYLSHDWLSEKRVVASTDLGQLLVFESGELLWEMHVLTKPSTVDSETTQRSGLTSVERKQEAEALSQPAPQVTVIKAYSKGFVCNAGPGLVLLFEKTEDKDGYRKCSEIRIPPDPCSSDPSQAEQQAFGALCISPSEETLTGCTHRGQLYSAALASAEMGKHGGPAQFEFLTESFHSATITGLSICYCKPIVATCSLDRSVRIWNFETNSLEVCREFQEQALSVALHPSGLFLLVGFSDKLRLLNLLMNDLRSFMEFSVRGCRECAFSNGGHLFAAVNGTVIQIYSTITFENVRNLKGHSGKVRSILWSEDDSRLVSCGADGAVYEWNTLSTKRESECVLKTCSYSDIAISPDAKTVFAVGTDCTLKEIQDHQILKDVPAEDEMYTAVCFSLSGRMLFTGTSSGTVRVMKYPLSSQKDWTEFQGHAAPITKMVITTDEQFLLTVAEDGCLLIWRIIDQERPVLKRDKQCYYSSEILITKTDLEEKDQNMQELKTRVEELNVVNQFQLRLKGMDHEREVREMTDGFTREIESLKSQNQVLKSEKEKMESEHKERMDKVLERNAKEKLDLESASMQNLMLEYQRYQELQQKSQEMQEDYERQLQDCEDRKTQALEEHTQQYELRLKESLVKLKETEDKAEQQQKMHEEMIRQIEEDADREILDIRAKYERILKEERDTSMRLKDETGIMRKKFSSLQTEIGEKNQETEKLRLEQQKLQGIIRSLEKDIVGLKREIHERDENIQEKEKCNYDMRMKNSHLEKFKFVLEHKIDELKKQIEPRENSIIEMRDQIHKMEDELGQFKRKNTQLELNISELKAKLRATDEDKRREIQRVRCIETLVKRFQSDLQRCVNLIQEPQKLKDSICELYRAFGPSDEVERVSEDGDMQKEFSRQREHLEKTVANYKRKISRDNENRHNERIRMIRENTSLMKENQELMRELERIKSHPRKFESS
ncbi:hypothetical protein GJAV_G00023590 [Gymnothorax javanicus]|nr:hypothetical protein GJAV_G00023590 [Gymnothorax javanicus]